MIAAGPWLERKLRIWSRSFIGVDGIEPSLPFSVRSVSSDCSRPAMLWSKPSPITCSSLARVASKLIVNA